jgi:hypothetical protein
VVAGKLLRADVALAIRALLCNFFRCQASDAGMRLLLVRLQWWSRRGRKSRLGVLVRRRECRQGVDSARGLGGTPLLCPGEAHGHLEICRLLHLDIGGERLTQPSSEEIDLVLPQQVIAMTHKG